MALMVSSSEMCFIVCALFSFNCLLFCFVFFLSCRCYKLLIISSMKAASIDGPFGFPAACPMLNMEMLYCEFLGANKNVTCLLADEGKCGQHVCPANDHQGWSSVMHNRKRSAWEATVRVSTDWSVCLDQYCSRIFTVQQNLISFRNYIGLTLF